MSNKIRILLAEDEQMLAEILSDTLTDRGFEVALAYNGEQALQMARTDHFDVIVTDVMMPRLDGFSLTRRLRSEGRNVPVLFLTARSATEDVVQGFKVGGNDFLRKPFAIDELIVRVQALAGRMEQAEDSDTEFQIGHYQFDTHNSTLSIGGESIVLAPREAAVLLRLCRQKGVTIEAAGLLRELWGDDNFFNLRSLNVYISRLRRHFAADSDVEIISVRGIGYRLVDKRN
ncbi:MAG: response regulator transcription factor [Rikenellaceae bacterium]|nr:response regulator transcription factor [Rikenellaceae bacterium]